MSDNTIIDFPRPPRPTDVGSDWERRNIDSSGGGGDGGGMNIEARVDRLEQDLSSVRSDVAAIRERLNHMPTTAQMYRTAIGAVVAIVTIFIPILGRVMGWW